MEITGVLKNIIKAYLVAVSLVIANRNIFTTSTGLLGVDPRAANRGCVVAVFEGAETPFVLEKVGFYKDVDGGPVMQLYKIVRECYLHGWIYGEACPPSSGLEPADICIK